jgi:hypothetical protein
VNPEGRLIVGIISELIVSFTFVPLFLSVMHPEIRIDATINVDNIIIFLDIFSLRPSYMHLY